MFTRIVLFVMASAALSLCLSVPGAPAQAAILADHTIVSQFPTIPESVIYQIRNNYRIFYGHTSHGSQIVTGMGMVYDEDTLYAYNNGTGTLSLTETGGDLGANGDLSWVAPTRSYLDSHPTCNMVMWSWCGQVSSNTEEGINIYLNAMTELEQDYPGVTFVYMTGHLDGTGPEENLYVRNNQIRAYCASHNKVLFDFADIESYDPDGTYYPDGSDDCAWCSVWCSTHSCLDCGGSCAHSHCFNCYQKGKSFWWMMARIAGWNSQTPGRGDVNGDALVNITDAVFVIDYIFGGGPAPNPYEQGDCDCNAMVNISDAVYLINYIFGGGPQPCSGL